MQTVSHEAIHKKRALFASKLLSEEHDLKILEREVEQKRNGIQQLNGAISACDALLQPPPLPEPNKKSPKNTA